MFGRQEVLASILICTYNRSASLRQTLQSLAAVSIPGTMPAELIVIDNGSTDATADTVRSCALPNLPIRYILEPRRGQCNARNTGIALAQGEILVWTDDDVRLPRNWLEGMCAPILSGKFDAVQGGVRLAPHLERPWLPKELRWMLGSTEGLGPDVPKWAIGANMAFAREILAKVPRFDPELGPGALGLEDDSLFMRQVKKAGYRVGTAFDVVAEHHCDEWRLGRRGFLSAARHGGRSMAYVEYHWEHVTVSVPRWQLAKQLLKLALYRLRHWRHLYQLGRPALQEIRLVRAIHFYRHYLHERKRARNYEKYGLVKFRPGTSSNGCLAGSTRETVRPASGVARSVAIDDTQRSG
jgi:glycosyltransferase involved in cell wall biosynthesis